MKIFGKISIIALSIVFTFSIAGLAQAATAVNLGTAAGFAVLGGSTITNTGSTVVNGDLGLSPGTSVTGFPPGTINGAQHITDAAAAQAQVDLITAYNATAAQTGAVAVSGDLGGLTLTPGVYNSASSLGLTGTLTLDGLGNPNAVFIFQIGSSLTTASVSRIELVNGAQACNVFWQVTSSATLGTNSNFVGSIFALTSITATTGATINGRVLARNGAVTLDIDSVTKPTCTVAVVTPTTTPVLVSEPVLTSTPVLISEPTPTITPVLVSEPVPAPKLPDTGIAPGSATNIPWNVITPAGIFVILLSFYLVYKKRLV